MMDIVAVLLLQGGHNTSVVMLGSAALGLACGAVGVFTMLRRRSLVADAVAHATLPGVALAFMLGAAAGFEVRAAALLTTGALGAALFATLAVQWLARRPRVTEDTAVAAVLAGGFGIGLALLSVVQTLRTGGQAGLDAYLLGSTAGMLEAEAIATAALAAVIVGVVALTIRPLAVAAFDPDFAVASGLNVRALDALIAALGLVAVVVGLRIVGLVLVVAMLIVPAAAARFWSDRLGVVVILSSLFGAASAFLGAAASAVGSSLPTGAVIVVTATGLFALSFLFGSARGIVVRALGARRRAGGPTPGKRPRQARAGTPA